jgi:uncharacterized protein (TIGR03118 family)
MKTIAHGVFSPPLKGIFGLCMFFILSAGCRKHDVHFLLSGYQKTVLVADVDGFGAARLDPTLVNAWGIAVVPNGPIWIASNHTSFTQVYDKTGAAILPAIPILGGESAPTGVVFNATSNFVVPDNGKPGRFIFAGEDGTLNAWNGGTATFKVADQSAREAVYKGLAMGSAGADTFLYATNFKGGKVDVFDKNYNLVTDKPFLDPFIPNDFAPFNIRNIGGWLYVTYAKLKGPDNEDDQAGAGNGFIDIFNTKGRLLKRFASRGALNSPWGIVEATSGFGTIGHAILVGNFGDGRINVFDSEGRFFGHLNDDKGQPIEIQGLWSIENNVTGADPNQLYFTAGPDDESHGLFGYLLKK